MFASVAQGGQESMTISTHARLVILACSLAAGQVAFGQTFGSIDGEARGVTGAAVAGVTVSATNRGTNAARSVITNDAGAYSFPSLAPGTYSLRAEKPGFKTVVRNEIELQVQQAARIDIELQVGQVNESIEVQGEAGTLVTDNDTVGTVIENRHIVELPLNGRNYLQLVSLAPNVSTGFAGQGQATARQGGIRAGETISVTGQRTNFNHYTLDGVENTDPNSGLQRGEKCA
jgi:Carboxypeptidase regulatory-like domain